MSLKFTPVNSSNIEGVHYDPETGQMTVRFRNGGTYAYGGVAQEHYDGFMSAESKGRYLHGTIKSRYKHSRKDD